MEEGCLDTEGPPSPLRIEKLRIMQQQRAEQIKHTDTVILSLRQ